MAATSSSNAWAVGRWMCASRPDAPTRTVIFHWNGTAWMVQSSPNLNLATGYNLLNGVAATSATNAWAVGQYAPPGDPYRTLILRWDGAAWTRQSSPNVGQSGSDLQGVVATSPSNAWAVGGSGGETPFILQWDGTAWRPQPDRPNVGAGLFPYLTGVAATSSSNAWAVGSYMGANAPAQTLIFHWDGATWQRQSSPNVGGGENVLTGVAATSASNAWAVGRYDHGSERRALILHWDGTSWERQSSPNVDMELNGVAATSANAWAVGRQDLETLILCWNGTTWERQSSPNVKVGGPAGDNILNGVAATSASNAWAVGIYGDGSAARTLVAPC